MCPAAFRIIIRSRLLGKANALTAYLNCLHTNLNVGTVDNSFDNTFTESEFDNVGKSHRARFSTAIRKVRRRIW